MYDVPAVLLCSAGKGVQGLCKSVAAGPLDSGTLCPGSEHAACTFNSGLDSHLMAHKVFK